MNRYRVHYYYQNDKTQPVADDRDLGVFEADNPGDALIAATERYCTVQTEREDFMTKLSTVLLTEAIRKDVPNVKLIVQQLRGAVEQMLSHVDYMHGACRTTDPVGAILPQGTLIEVRQTLERTRI